MTKKQPQQQNQQQKSQSLQNNHYQQSHQSSSQYVNQSVLIENLKSTQQSFIQSRQLWFRETYYSIQNKVYRLIDTQNDTISLNYIHLNPHLTNQYQQSKLPKHPQHFKSTTKNQNIKLPYDDQPNLPTQEEERKSTQYEEEDKDFRSPQPYHKRDFYSFMQNHQGNKREPQMLQQDQKCSEQSINQLKFVHKKSDNSKQKKHVNNNIKFLNNFIPLKKQERLDSSKRITSILTPITSLLHHIRSIQLPTLLSYLPFFHPKPTLYSQYKHKSLAILNNSIDLQQAVIRAMEYNIPLMQIVMNDDKNQKNSNSDYKKDSQIIWQKVLNNFTISHFINQNFVLYGDWQYQKYKPIFQDNNNTIYENDCKSQESLNNSVLKRYQDEVAGQKEQQKQSGRILFRRGSLVFAEMMIGGLLDIHQEELLQRLQQVRNSYYKLCNRKELPQTDYKISYNNCERQQEQHQQQQQNESNNLSINHIKQIQQQILNDYLQQKRLEQELQQIQHNNNLQIIN